MALPVISILGCGWLGLPLAISLKKRGYVVKGSTTRKERVAELEQAEISPYIIKATEGSWLSEDLNDFLSSDILIIAIPPNSRKNKDSTHAIEIHSLFEFIKESKTNILTIIYISSTSVYSDLNRLVTEKDVVSVEDADNKILAEAEYYIQQSVISNKLILRLGGLTGYNRMLGKFFAGKNQMQGGNQPVNLLHRDDAVAAIIFLMEKNIRNNVFNICSPQHPVKKEFYKKLCSRFELKSPVFPESLYTSWKEVSVERLEGEGYRFIFPDPYTYSYLNNDQ